MSVPDGLYFTKEHEWVAVDSDSVATIGITQFAQESLGDITFLQLPEEGTELRKDDPFGVVESVKAVSDLYAPVTGRVMEVNLPLLNAPELINDDPYTEGWMVKLELKHTEETEELMSSEQYKEYVEEQA